MTLRAGQIPEPFKFGVKMEYLMHGKHSAVQAFKVENANFHTKMDFFHIFNFDGS